MSVAYLPWAHIFGLTCMMISMITNNDDEDEDGDDDTDDN